MYLPSRFASHDTGLLRELIRLKPLATLMSVQAGESFVSHLPLVLEEREDEWFLIGHLARANSHSRFLSESAVKVIFHGPQAYITPRWYTEDDVPTWNYAVAHLTGSVRMIEDQKGILECLEKLSTHAESNVSDPWKFWLPEDLSSIPLTSVIAGFEIRVEDIKTKFKLSQNRSAEDRTRVIAGLEARGDAASLDVARLMKSL